jgi:hypothetical protein
VPSKEVASIYSVWKCLTGYFEEITDRMWGLVRLGGESRVKHNFKLLGLSDLKNGVTFDKHRKVWRDHALREKEKERE